MSIDIMGGTILTGALDIIAQSLTIPVLIILLILFILAVIDLGSLIAEFGSRKKIGMSEIKKLIYEINYSNTQDEIKNIIKNNKQLLASDKQILSEIADIKDLTPKSREALACKMVDNEEEKIDSKLRKTDIIIKIGPTLGLMGTLIPLGPGLAALATGDINTLANSLTVAFNTTIVGIGAGALAYFEARIRKNWYMKYISDLDVLSNAILDSLENMKNKDDDLRW